MDHETLVLTLTGTDVDAGDAAALGFSITTPPARGTLAPASGDPLNATFTYTPPDNHTGDVTFAFTVTDPSGAVSAPAVVVIAVTNLNDAHAHCTRTEFGC